MDVAEWAWHFIRVGCPWPVSMGSGVWAGGSNRRSSVQVPALRRTREPGDHTAKTGLDWAPGRGIRRRSVDRNDPARSALRCVAGTGLIEGRETVGVLRQGEVNGVGEITSVFIPRERVRHVVGPVDLHLWKPEKAPETIGYNRPLQVVDGFKHPSGLQHHRHRNAERVVRSEQIPGGPYLYGIVVCEHTPPMLGSRTLIHLHPFFGDLRHRSTDRLESDSPRRRWPLDPVQTTSCGNGRRGRGTMPPRVLSPSNSWSGPTDASPAHASGAPPHHGWRGGS